MDLWKKPIHGGEEVRLTDGAGAEVQPAWSPDGRTIAFSVDGEQGGLFLMPSDGGQAVRVTDFGANPAWAPDGRRIAFDASGSIYWVNYAGGAPVRILSGISGTPHLEWTPDGRQLFYWDRTQRDIFVVDVDSGEKRRLRLIPTGEEAAGLTFSRQTSTLVFSKGAFGGDKDLWRVKIDPLTGMPAEPATRLTVSGTDDEQCRFSPDGKRLAFVVQQVDRQLWGVSLDRKTGLAAGASRLLTLRGQRNYYPAATPDGKLLAWTSQNAGQGVIYYRREGEEARKLTRDWDRSIREVGPTLAPDGIQIAYSSTAGGAYQLWRMPAPDSVALQLTTVQRPLSDAQPSWSPDGKILAFYSNRSGNWDIWAVDALAGGEPKQLLDWPSNELYPTWSPDGRYLAFSSTRGDNTDIWRLRLDTGEAEPFVRHPAAEGPAAWSPDGSHFYFSSDRGGGFAIWVMPGEGGEAQRVTGASMTLPESALYTKFALTNEELIVPLENRRGDVYILENLE